MKGGTQGDMLHLAAPLAGLVITCAAHLCCSRIRRSVAILPMLAGSGACGLAGVLALGWAAFLLGETGWNALAKSLLVDVPVFGCLAYGYANFVNLGQSSVRVRIFRELRAKPHGLSLVELESMYNEDAMLAARLSRLVGDGDLVEERGRYWIGRRRWVWVGRLVFGIQRALLLRAGELRRPPGAGGTSVRGHVL